jgi:hypothetical protein
MQIYLERKLIEGFTMTVNEKPVEVPNGYQYILTASRGTVFKKSSWFLSSENTPSAEEATKLLLEHLNYLIRDVE